MNRPRIVRALRITWTGFWGLAAVLLVALWVRSYWKWDRIVFPKTIVLESIQGVAAADDYTPYVPPYDMRPWFHLAYPGGEEAHALWRESTPHVRELGFDFAWSDKELGAAVPLWFLVAIAAGLGAAPWIRWSNRFSLRTLLIAMTLVAVGLGLIVWLAADSTGAATILGTLTALSR